ncbi:MAG: cohesin domain-containing protein, partial [Bacteroidota bacterium]
MFSKLTKLTLLKKLFAVLLLGLGLQVSLYAQPSFQLDSGTGLYTNGENFCVTVNTRDFTDIVVMQYAITWDKDAVSFLTVEDFELPGLDTNDFDISTIQDGFLTVEWESATGDGATIDDDRPLFDICFQTSNDCGSESTIEVNRSSVVINRSGTTRNIRFFPDGMRDAEISIAGVPVTISAEELAPCPEEFFCVAVTADVFERVESFQ